MAALSPWTPISAAKVVVRAKNSPCDSIPCLPPLCRTPDVWIGAPPPTFPQEETQGWREEEAAPQEGRDGTDGTDGHQHGAEELLGLGPSCSARMGSARPILCLQLWLWVQSSAQELDPDGRNVCR